MRILHIGSASPFVDFLVAYFERAAPGQNTVVRIPSAAPRSGRLGTARAAVRYARHLGEVTRRARRADVVVAHMLTLPSAVALVASRRNAFRVWSGWGADYYGRGESVAGDLYGPQTLRLVERLQLDRGPRGGRAVTALTERVVRRAVRRTDAFSAPIPDDLAVMRGSFPMFRGEYHQLNYADLDSFAGRVSGDAPDVLLGNSAWAANNHLEALEWLSRLDLGGRRVVTPLTYGPPAYRDAVVARGRELLGDAFDPLLEPLPFDAYQDRVSRCGVVVMNHHRQQGLGNVGIGLYAGAHVYLSRRNPLFAFLDRSGLDVHDIEETGHLLDAPLTGDALERRRARLAEIWGPDVVLDNVRRLLAATSARR